MALWDKIKSRGNVVDRRSMIPLSIGGLGIGGIALVMLVSMFTGIDTTDIFNQLNTIQIENQNNLTPNEFEGVDEYEEFASIVLGSNNDTWKRIFTEQNKTYSPPTLVLFRTATNSSCGAATSQVGPHYCPIDQTIYLDETFFDELTNRFGAEGGDVAEAYVIAHEVGHHAQNELDIMKVIQNQQQSNPQQANELSIRLELQADCFAGIWAHSIKDNGVFLPGEIHEAIDAAAAVGDDRIQERVSGYVNPESWTHGSSEQRKDWFNRGYSSGTLDSCDTFN